MGPDAKPHSLNKWWKLLIGISKVVITDLKEIDIQPLYLTLQTIDLNL